MRHWLKLYDRLDRQIALWMSRHGIRLLRISLGIVFFWFGVLKFFPGLSPAQDLAIKTMRILTNNPRKFVGLQGYGLLMSEQLPLEIPASDSTRKYLKTKKDKLGHRLSSV